MTSEHGYRPEAVREFVRTVPSLVGCFAMTVRAAAKAERGGADFVQVGPVFGNGSDPQGVEGLALLRKVRDAIHLPIIAFGGVATPNLAAAALGAGATESPWESRSSPPTIRAAPRNSMRRLSERAVSASPPPPRRRVRTLAAILQRDRPME